MRAASAVIPEVETRRVREAGGLRNSFATEHRTISSEIDQKTSGTSPGYPRANFTPVVPTRITDDLGSESSGRTAELQFGVVGVDSIKHLYKFMHTLDAYI